MIVFLKYVTCFLLASDTVSSDNVTCTSLMRSVWNGGSGSSWKAHISTFILWSVLSRDNESMTTFSSPLIYLV